MRAKIQIGVLLALVIFGGASEALAQKGADIKPPPETATLAESQKWLVDSFTKYASYKTRVTTVAVSNAKFEGCVLTYTQVHKSGSVSTAVMGATRTINSVKDDVSIDTSLIAPDGITVTDHIYPEIQTLELKLTNDTRIVEIVVKREASDAIKTALMQVRRLCSARP